MELQAPPKRTVLRYHIRYEHDEASMISQFLASTEPEAPQNFFIHTIPPNHSSKMHTVLDFHHVENPTVNLDEIPHEVFVVERAPD